MEKSRHGFTIAEGIYIVIALFASFGNFLIDFAPPIKNSQILVGGIQFIILLFLLFILRRYNSYENLSRIKIGFLITVVIVSFLAYLYNYNKSVVSLNDIKQVKGAQLLEEWKSYCRGYNYTKAECEIRVIERLKNEKEINNYSIWTPDSIFQNEIILFGIYFLFVVSLSVNIFLFADWEAEKSRIQKISKPTQELNKPPENS